MSPLLRKALIVQAHGFLWLWPAVSLGVAIWGVLDGYPVAGSLWLLVAVCCHLWGRKLRREARR